MSMDLTFWKYKAGAVRSHEAVYQAICCGEAVDKLETLPIEEIVQKIRSVFSDWTVGEDGRAFSKERRGSFQLRCTPQAVRVDCRDMQEEDVNALTDVMVDFGCPLYDPQITTRFDSWTDR